MKRVKDWRARLAKSVEEQRTTPYATGVHDCVLFTANCIEAMTGVDLAHDYRGTYSNFRGAVQVLRRAGYQDLIEVASKNLEEIPVGRAVAGDVGALPSNDEIGWNMGIINGEVMFVLRPDGVGVIHRQRVTRAFRVP